MNATDWVAIYAAIVGSIALFWDFLKWRREGPNLQILSPPKDTDEPELRSSGGTSVFRVIYTVTVMNSGFKPITILRGTAMFEDLRVFDEVGPNLRIYKTNPEDNFTFLEGSLPIKLDAGETKSVAVELKFESEPTRDFAGMYSATLVFDMATTEGRLKRKTEFHVRGYYLSRKLRKTPWN